MQPDKFTTLTQQAFQAAQSDAEARGHSELANEHLLRAFLDQADGITRPRLEKVGVPTTKLGERLDGELNRRPKIVSGSGQLHLSNGLRLTLDAAQKEMTGLKDEFLRAEHYLLALLESTDPAARALKDAQVTA